MPSHIDLPGLRWKRVTPGSLVAGDRRSVTLALTDDGSRVAEQIAEVEERLYARIDGLVAGTPVREALTLLRAFAGGFPAGQAVVRRGGGGHEA